MNNFNFSVIEGNLTKDPKLKGEVCRMQVASSRTITLQKGNRVEKQSIFDIVTVGKLAETCGKYLKKGSRVLVSGMLKKKSGVYLEGKEVNFLAI